MSHSPSAWLSEHHSCERQRMLAKLIFSHLAVFTFCIIMIFITFHKLTSSVAMIRQKLIISVFLWFMDLSLSVCLLSVRWWNKCKRFGIFKLKRKAQHYGAHDISPANDENYYHVELIWVNDLADSVYCFDDRDNWYTLHIYNTITLVWKLYVHITGHRK